MKKLKIISLCFLISLLFIPKTYARTDFNFVTKSFSKIDTYLSNHNDKTINDFYDMILSNIDYEPPYNNYICNYNDSTYLDCFSSDGDFTLNSYYSSGGFLNLYNSSSTSRDRFTITFNNSGEYVSSTTQHWNLVSLSNLAYAQPSSSSKLWSLPIASNFNTIFFDNSTLPSSVDKIQNLKFNNLSTSYANSSEVPLYALSENSNYSYIPTDYYGYNNPYACILDANNLGGFRTSSLSNISDFEYRITADNLSSDDYGIEGSFAFQNSSFSLSDNNFNSSDYWEIEVIKGPDSVGDYNVNGVLSWNDTTKVLTVNYGVYATDSEPVKVDSIIKLKPKGSYAEDYFSGTLNYYSCNPTNPDIFLNDSYGYTDNTTGLTNSYDTSLMNFLNSTSNPDLSAFINMKTLLPPGPVDSILTIPLTMLNLINNWLNGEYCEPITVNLPFVNQNIQLQCMRTFYHDIGATAFFEGVGTIASLIILVEYFVGLYNWIDDNLQVTHKKLKAWGTGEL